MPGKHNAGGCGCCGCACEVLGVEVAGAAFACCGSADGTYLMTPVNVPALGYCVVTTSVPANGSPVASNLPPTVGPDCSTECELTFSTGTANNIAVCETAVENYTYEPNITIPPTLVPYCGISWLLLDAVTIELRVARVGGVSRITVIITWDYTDAWAKIVFDGLDNRHECQLQGWQANPSVRLWRLTDTYQLDGDCTDGTEIPHVSRVMDDIFNATPGTDETQIIWGSSDSLTYSLCEPPTVTLVA